MYFLLAFSFGLGNDESISQSLQWKVNKKQGKKERNKETKKQKLSYTCAFGIWIMCDMSHHQFDSIRSDWRGQMTRTINFSLDYLHIIDDVSLVTYAFLMTIVDATINKINKIYILMTKSGTYVEISMTKCGGLEESRWLKVVGMEKSRWIKVVTRSNLEY